MKKNGFWKGFIVGISVIIGFIGLLIAFDVGHLGQAAEVFFKLQRFSYQDVPFSKLIDGVMEGMVNSLGDPYSAYLDSAEYRDLEQNITGSYGGVGILITETESSTLEVVSPFKGTPAYRAGIKSGDIIVKIGDKETSGMELTEAANLMKGPPGTKVKLTVRPKGNGQLKEYVIEREEIHIPSVEGQILPGTKIAYINLMMFSQQTEKDLIEIFEKINVKEAEGIILDMRDNPGGDLSAAVDIAGFFIPQGPAVHIVSKTGRDSLTTEDKYLSKKLVVLVNGGSASASEIVAGAIKDNGTGMLVGTTTFGKGLVQSVFEITPNSALKLTTAKYLTPKGNDIHGKGITPDVVVEMDANLSREVLLYAPMLEKDVQLQEAVSLIKQK